MKKVAVRFLKSLPPYNVGEIAGFFPHVSTDLVRIGTAEFLNVEDNEIIKAQKAEKAEEKEPEIKKNEQIVTLLLGTKQEILESILETDENGDHIVNDNDLGDMLFYERQAKNRKGVVKVIEDVSFDRIKAR